MSVYFIFETKHNACPQPGLFAPTILKFVLTRFTWDCIVLRRRFFVLIRLVNEFLYSSFV